MGKRIINKIDYKDGLFKVYMNGVARFKYYTNNSKERYDYLMRYLIQAYKNHEELIVVKYEGCDGTINTIYKNK